MRIRHRVGLRALVAGVTLGLGGACETADRVVPTAADAGVPVATWYTPEQNQALSSMVHMLAEGLADPAAREALLRALRSSTLTEHKVVLAAFLSTNEGKTVLDAARARLGATPADLSRIVSQLPPIDLYVPAREHRLSWRAAEPIAVMALYDDATPLTAYLPGGLHVPVDRMDPTPTKGAVLVLGPAEFKQVRPDAFAAMETYATIEDATPVTPVNAMCYEDCGGGGGGGGPATGPAQLRLGTIETWNVCDNAFCWETNEFEFRSKDGVTGLSRTLRCTNVPATGSTPAAVACYGQTVVNDAAPSEVSHIDVKVWETDFLPSDDYWADYLTPIPPYNYSELRVAVGHGSFLLWQYPYGFGCSPPNPAGDPYCPRVGVQFTW